MAPEHGTGGAHLGGRDGGLREHTAAEHRSPLWRVARVIFGFAAMDGLHGASLTEDTRATCVGTQVGQPVPGEHPRDGDHHPLSPLSRRSHGFEEGLRVGVHMARHEELAALVEEADVHHTGVQVDAAVKWGRCGVQSP
jgi:hypothetical protein